MDNCRGPESPKQLHRLAKVERKIAKAKSTYRYSGRLCTAFNTGFQPNLGVMMTFFDLKIVGKIFRTWSSPPSHAISTLTRTGFPTMHKMLLLSTTKSSAVKQPWITATGLAFEQWDYCNLDLSKHLDLSAREFFSRLSLLRPVAADTVNNCNAIWRTECTNWCWMKTRCTTEVFFKLGSSKLPVLILTCWNPHVEVALQVNWDWCWACWTCRLHHQSICLWISIEVSA